MISVLILTKNEELDIVGCLQSVSWCDDIHVFDSFSEDRTVEIAIKSGAKVTQHKFEGYASQRNAALTTVNYKYPWILILDADERVPQHLAENMVSIIKDTNDSICAFRLRRRDFLDNTWLKHAQISAFYIRLVRKGMVHYQREVNEVLHVDGSVGEIDDYFIHYPFSKGYTHWLNKHNRYSSMEAQRWVDENAGLIKFSFKKALLSKDVNEKRYHQKGLFYKLPGRPIIKWLYMVIIRGAFSRWPGRLNLCNSASHL